MAVSARVVEKAEFKNYPAERLIIDSITSRLTGEERLLRLHLLDRIIEKGGPVSISSLIRSAAPLQIETDSLIHSMMDKRIIVADEAGTINFAYPVSALPTNHKVALKDGRGFYAMCAVDAMGAAFTFKQDIGVDSICADCGQKISIAIEDEEIAELSPKSAHVLHVDLNNADNWAGSC
jgi:hypothetical protein